MTVCNEHAPMERRIMLLEERMRSQKDTLDKIERTTDRIDERQRKLNTRIAGVGGGIAVVVVVLTLLARILG